MKYSDLLCKWLKDNGYSHCYFVAGGNIMHLLNSATQFMTCVPVVHEVAAVIAAEYHNASLISNNSQKNIGKAIAMVTAGPGLTNAITGLSGAWLESRELLLLGGQVKVEDLSFDGLRQLGIQEVDGVEIASPVCKRSFCLKEPIPYEAFFKEISASWLERPGPVFVEIPLDVQAVQVPDSWTSQQSYAITTNSSKSDLLIIDESVEEVSIRIDQAKRPVLLIGGGTSRSTAHELEKQLDRLLLPVMTTWNGSDRYGSNHSNYFGRPNTWGQRYSNLLLQQSDLVVAIGTRLGLQQTGFNWKQFVPVGDVIQIDIDPYELAKPNPNLLKGIRMDADIFLRKLLSFDLGSKPKWLDYCRKVKKSLPVSEACNPTPSEYLNPYEMVLDLSKICNSSDHIVPCSSGGAFTVMMQAFEVKQGQTMVTNKGLASMGYGLSGAIGTSFSDPDSRTILVEGDGGFIQNLQELGTVGVNQLNIKIFLFCNEGYASIRMTQKNYFNGNYIGCDVLSGLGFPDWNALALAYNIDIYQLDNDWVNSNRFNELWLNKKPALFLVPLSPEQTYFPKISSRISDNGGMESNPLHLMSPDLPKLIKEQVARFISE